MFWGTGTREFEASIDYIEWQGRFKGLILLLFSSVRAKSLHFSKIHQFCSMLRKSLISGIQYPRYCSLQGSADADSRTTRHRGDTDERSIFDSKGGNYAY